MTNVGTNAAQSEVFCAASRANNSGAAREPLRMAEAASMSDSAPPGYITPDAMAQAANIAP
jgi:hypothetical protein